MSWEVVIPVRTKSELNQREHWGEKARRVRLQRIATMATMRSHKAPRPPRPWLVRLTRIAPRTLDEGDNLQSACKAIRDQICQELGLPKGRGGYADDRHPDIAFVYGQQTGKVQEYAVKVQIETRKELKA